MNMKKTQGLSSYSAINPEFAQIVRFGAHFHKDKNKSGRIWKTLQDMQQLVNYTSVQAVHSYLIHVSMIQQCISVLYLKPNPTENTDKF